VRAARRLTYLKDDAAFRKYLIELGIAGRRVAGAMAQAPHGQRLAAWLTKISRLEAGRVARRAAGLPAFVFCRCIAAAEGAEALSAEKTAQKISSAAREWKVTRPDVTHATFLVFDPDPDSDGEGVRARLSWKRAAADGLPGGPAPDGVARPEGGGSLSAQIRETLPPPYRLEGEGGASPRPTAPCLPAGPGAGRREEGADDPAVQGLGRDEPEQLWETAMNHRIAGAVCAWSGGETTPTRSSHA